MLMVLSPAKTLDYQTPLPIQTHSQPDFLTQAALLVAQLRTFDTAQLADLMRLSDSLANLNVTRFRQWQPPFTLENARQAVLAFKGDVYTGLQAADFSAQDFAFTQEHLRILSGLYGLLRPLDLIQPYRLEMGTALPNPKGKDLYAFWKTQITPALNQALQATGSNVLLNLASQEYAGAIDRRLLTAPVLDVVFKDRKNAQYKIISFYAKYARGLMARFVIKEHITDPLALQEFALEGYRYSPEQSQSQQLVFLRDQPPAQ